MSDAERAQTKPLWRRLKLVILFSIIIGSILTLAMRGIVQPETIRIVNGSDYVSSVYGEFSSRTTVGYREEFSGWSVGYKSESARARIEASPSSLIINGSFLNASIPASVGVFKSAVVNITSSPILEVRLNVTGATGYGLRFFSQYSNGTQFDVWWEASPLDHRPAKGYELIRANMQLQAFLATGQELKTLTKFEVYVEVRPNTALNFRLELLELNFLSEETGPIGSPEGYKAVYIDLTTKPDEPSSWYLNKIQIGANLLASTGTIFTLHLVVANTLYTTLETPSSYTYSPLTPTYNFAFYPKESQRIFSELLPRSDISIVLIADSGSITEVTLNYLDFVFLPRPEQATDFSQQTRALYYTYFVFFLFLLPLGLAILVYREFFGHQAFSTKALALVLLVGLACRFALSPLTAHVFDMDIFLSSARAWFQYGTPRGSLGPTLPVTFFVYWIPYSFYALIQSLGFQDVFLPSHAAGIVEAIFIKLPPLTGDVFLFAMLLRFGRGGRTFTWASFYFLNPLAIFTSSVRGHYDTVTMGLIVAGAYWMKNHRVERAGLAFLASGMIQLLGFIPFVLLLLQSFWTRQYKFGLGLLGVAGTMALAYAPQRDMLYRLVLGLSSVTSNTKFAPLGSYTLLGSLGWLSFISNFHPIILLGGILLTGAALDLVRRGLNAESILLYTGLSYLVFLLVLGPVYSWFWVLPIGILYSTLRDKDSLGAYMLVFGAAAAFVTVFHTVGSAYYLLGEGYGSLQPWIEGVPNGTRIFVIMVTILAGLLLAHMISGRNDRRPALLASSLTVLGLYVLVYFWVGIYPV